MSGPHDELHLRALDDLASIALREPAEPTVAEHISRCAHCQAELAGYHRVVALGQLSGRAEDDHDMPPPRLWQRIEAEVTRRATPVPRRHTARWRRALLAAAATVAVLGATVGGWLIGNKSSSHPPPRSAQAMLQAQPGTSDDVHGRATMRSSATGYTMTVTTDGLTADDGYYEVWLYNPSTNVMVAIGTLGEGGNGSFTVPGGLDTQAYHVVDVSAQKYNGDNRHQRSVLRGQLTH